VENINKKTKKKPRDISRISIGLAVICLLALISQIYLLIKSGGSSLRVYSVTALLVALGACLFSAFGGNLQSKKAKIVFLIICLLYIFSFVMPRLV